MMAFHYMMGLHATMVFHCMMVFKSEQVSRVVYFCHSLPPSRRSGSFIHEGRLAIMTIGHMDDITS